MTGIGLVATIYKEVLKINKKTVGWEEGQRKIDNLQKLNPIYN